MSAEAARLVGYLGAAWLTGLLPVTRYVLAVAPPSTPGTTWARGRDDLARRITRSVDLATLAVLLGTAAVLALAIRDLAGSGLADDPVGAARALLGTRFGQVTALRLAVVVALWTVLRPVLPARALPDPRTRREDRLLEVAWACLGLLLLLTFPLTGHAAAGPRPLVHVTVDAVHLAAAATWLAGILALGLLLPAVLARQRERVRLGLLAPALGRFARLALVAVTLVVLTGFVSAATAVDGAGQLRTTTYGQALTVKLWLVAWVLALGALNHVVLVPRLVRAAGDPRTGGAPQEARLAATVTAELLLGVLVVGTTAVLVGLPPPG